MEENPPIRVREWVLLNGLNFCSSDRRQCNRPLNIKETAQRRSLIFGQKNLLIMGSEVRMYSAFRSSGHPSVSEDCGIGQVDVLCWQRLLLLKRSMLEWQSLLQCVHLKLVWRCWAVPFCDAFFPSPVSSHLHFLTHICLKLFLQKCLCQCWAPWGLACKYSCNHCGKRIEAVQSHLYAGCESWNEKLCNQFAQRWAIIYLVDSTGIEVTNFRITSCICYMDPLFKMRGKKSSCSQFRGRWRNAWFKQLEEIVHSFHLELSYIEWR